MPGFVTHYLFGADTFRSIRDPQLRSRIQSHPKAYGLGLEGPDVFFYYLPSYLHHPQNIGNIAHAKETGHFFANLMESRCLFPEKSSRQAIADAYIMGFLGHYTLDCTAHPFIYAFTHYDAGSPPSDQEYFGQHAYLETELDNSLLIAYRGELPSEFPMSRTIALTLKERLVISRMLQYAYTQTYRSSIPELKVTRRQCFHAAFWMQGLTALMHDPSGQKKVLVRSVEQQFIGRAMISAMIPSDFLCFVKDPLNMTHRTWTHPWTGAKSSEDFLDLWDIAKKHYLSRLTSWQDLVNSGFNGEKQLAFLSEYGNRSFSSGLPL